MGSTTNRWSTQGSSGRGLPLEDAYVKPKLIQLSVDETMSGLVGDEIEKGQAKDNTTKRPS